ncbi:hypothetical protein [Delftia acidovorans]|uniref:Uncharacterized protein n=1 Tax=Delftia acidovorans TaxID=80866 RepID=A0AAJ2R625_DELAC|nr:hypothetical protein [Delftia acidovorans]MDX4957803.1 hypothetical protein [Delftia acidovorans]
MTTAHLLPAALTALFIATVPIAGAQEKSSLIWTPMRTVVLNSTNFPSTGTAEEQQILKQLWSEDLSRVRRNVRGLYPVFLLIGDVRKGPRRIIFSMFSSAGSERCDPPANGASSHDIYSMCNMRVTPWPQSNGKQTDLPNYCAIFGEKPEIGRIEYSFDPTLQTINFRTVQYGKIVQECNKTLKLD